MGMNVGRASGDDDEVNSTINTTPLVDVMLVLLIIFLITIPVVTTSVKVELPKETIQIRESKPENIVVSVDNKGRMFMYDTPIRDIRDLTERLKKFSKMDPQPEVHIRGDLSANYDGVGRVIFACRSAGISKIASIVNKVILLFLGVLVVLPKLGNVTILGWEGFFTTVLFAIVFAAMADLIGGPTVADRRALLVVSSTANVGLALSVLKSSGMVERFGATVMGVFVVRAAVGIVMKMLLARRFAKETREASNPELARLETT